LARNWEGISGIIVSIIFDFSGLSLLSYLFFFALGAQFDVNNILGYALLGVFLEH
jgi:hypothetical protein